MRSITTNWNSTAYNSAGTFIDATSGASVTIPANTPVNFRSMVDSVEAGSYIYAPDALVALPATIASAPLDVDDATVSVTLAAAAIDNAPIKAVSSHPARATVSPAMGHTSPDGTCLFKITSVGVGEATITFTCGAVSDTVVVTVT